MSLYNLVNGVNQATFYILPMLGKHPDNYPRFRDCFVGEVSNSDEVNDWGLPVKQTDKSERVISIYTRVGGGNRHDYEEEIKELRAMPTYIKDYDDDFDTTFATFLFGVPKEFEADYDLVISEGLHKTSQKYRDKLSEVYPKLAETFHKMFEEIDK